jgi:hypothetical protein
MQYLAQQARAFADWDLVENLGKQMLLFDPQYAGGHLVAALAAEHRAMLSVRYGN